MTEFAIVLASDVLFCTGGGLFAGGLVATGGLLAGGGLVAAGGF